MAQINEWLSVDRASGEGDTTITLTASSSRELNDRIASLEIRGITKSVYMNVRQGAFVPIITLTEKKLHFTCGGGTASTEITSNASWYINRATLPDWISVDNYYGNANSTETINISVSVNMAEMRDYKIPITLFTNEDVVIAELTITQDAISYEELGYAELVYETDTDGETIKLFGEYKGNIRNGSYLAFYHINGSAVNSKNFDGVQDIVIDGVRQTWDLADSFYIEKAGEHIVYVKFKDNIIKTNPRSSFKLIIDKGEYYEQYPFRENTHLKRASLPSNLSCDEADNDSLFRDCKRLESIEIKNVSCMGVCFADGDINLQNVILPSNLTSIPNMAFNGCSSLLMTFPQNIKSIGSDAFRGVTLIGEGVLDLRGVSVGGNAFLDSVFPFEKVIIDEVSNSASYQGCSGTLSVEDNMMYLYALSGSKFSKLILWSDVLSFEGTEYLTEVEYMIYGLDIITSGEITSPNLNKISIKSFVAPNITFNSVAEVGTLYYPQGADYTTWKNALPNWEYVEVEEVNVINNDYFWIEVNSIDGSIRFTNDISFSFNQEDWYEVKEYYNYISLIPNKRMYIRGLVKTFYGIGLSSYRVGGDITSLGSVEDRTFEYLFSDERIVYENEELTDASELILQPITTPNCYLGMFRACTNLVAIPALPATTLAEGCYKTMFYGCKNLTTAPALPATILAKDCYNSMFGGCKSLINAPAIPATILADSCCNSMFDGCSNLTTAPELLATTLTKDCYRGMFDGCSKINYIKMLGTNIVVTSPYFNSLSGWVKGVSERGTFVKHPNMNSLPRGNDGIPYNWNVEDATL